MWNNVRDAFPNELKSLYRTIRAEGTISYDNVEQRFETHQHTWPEAIFNEDAYFKYVKPFIDDGEDNLAMCLGSKEQQRKWWMFNRFKYIDSKYLTGNALSSYIQARVYSPSDLEITPYASIYANAEFGTNGFVQVRGQKDTAVTVPCPSTWNPAGSDGVLRIYSADQIKDLGDLSGFQVGDVSFAAATKLQSIKLGSSDSSYINEHLVNVGFGNNTLLKSIDIQRCPNLTQMVDVSGCTGLETVHLEETNVAGIHLADASAIRELYLPASITNLTLKNQSKLETLEIADMSNIETLWVEGAMADDAIDWIDDIASSNRKLRIVGFDKTFESDDDFNSLWDKIRNSKGLGDSGLNEDYAYLNGTFTVNELKRGIYDSLSDYPFLTINYTTLGDYMYKMYLENSNKFTEYSDDEITKFRDYAFRSSYIQTINCPNVTEIGIGVFMNSSITTINCPNVVKINSDFKQGGMKNVTATFGKLEYIGTNVINSLTDSSIASLDLSNVTTVFTTTFGAMSGRIELRLPSLLYINHISNTGYGAFDGIGTASLLDIGKDAQMATGSTNTTYNRTFGNTSFRGNSNLTALILRSTTMYTFIDGANVFNNTPIRQLGNYSTVGQGYIYVPRALVDSYKSDWANKTTTLSSLVDYIRAIEDYPEICDPS